MKRLRAAGKGAYVVMTAEAAKAGLGQRFPIGQIVSLREPWTVGVRKLGQTQVGRFAAVFWAPAPNRLVNYLR